MRGAEGNGAKVMELDHSSSEILDVELGIKYKSVTYQNAMAAGEHKYLPGYPNTPSTKATCPKCKHEFQTGTDNRLGNPNIIF